MATRDPLTSRAIAAFTYRYGPGSTALDLRYDGKVRGLAVRVSHTGAKSYVFDYRHGGRRRRVTIARCDEIKLDQARERALRMRLALIDGDDPGRPRQAAATFGQLRGEYLTHARSRKKTWAADAARLDRHLPKAWAARPLDGFTLADDLAPLLARIAERRGTVEANRTHALLRRMFELALAWGRRERTLGNPAQGWDRFAEKSRKVRVHAHQLQALAAAISETPSVYVRGYLWLALLVGARKSELLRARRARGEGGEPWVDWERALLVVPEAKAGGEDHYPLSSHAMALLQTLPPVAGNPYLFVGRRRGSHLVNLQKPWAAIRARAGLGDLRIHDLRRSFGSMLLDMDVPTRAVQELLNHRNITTTAIYARLGEAKGREHVERLGETVMDSAGVGARHG